MTDPSTASGRVHPHGSEVEQVHRVMTTDQGVDAWVIAEEAVAFVRERVAREFERQAGNCNPDDPEGSAVYSRWAMAAADRVRHPERYEGVTANVD